MLEQFEFNLCNSFMFWKGSQWNAYVSSGLDLLVCVCLLFRCDKDSDDIFRDSDIKESS